jgi:hypothetical protein
LTTLAILQPTVHGSRGFQRATETLLTDRALGIVFGSKGFDVVRGRLSNIGSQGEAAPLAVLVASIDAIRPVTKRPKGHRIVEMRVLA